MNQEEIVEREFLSILVLNPKIGFDLLQIKPKYLQNPKNKLLMEAIMKSYKEHGVVDISQLVAYSPHITPELVTDVITDDYLPLTNMRKQFMVCQIEILNRYKKKVINDLLRKMNKGEISCDDYLKNMAIINEIEIKVSSDYLTFEELEENIKDEKCRIVLNNFSVLNETLELSKGDFLTIGANTGAGKSGLLLNLMNDLMGRYQCIYFNMEMNKSTIYKRMISIRADVPIYNIEKDTSEYQKELIQKAMKSIVESKVIVEHKATYIDEIKNVLKVCKKDGTHTILFLDHIGIIKSRGNKSQYEQMTDIAKQLRQICLDYDCTIIAACQLNRSSYSADELSLSMLKDSGELENSSSKVILLYRDKEDKKEQPDSYKAKMILSIEKNRNGKLGQVICEYDKTKQIFKEVTKWN